MRITLSRKIAETVEQQRTRANATATPTLITVTHTEYTAAGPQRRIIDLGRSVCARSVGRPKVCTSVSHAPSSDLGQATSTCHSREGEPDYAHGLEGSVAGRFRGRACTHARRRCRRGRRAGAPPGGRAQSDSRAATDIERRRRPPGGAEGTAPCLTEREQHMPCRCGAGERGVARL